MRDEMQMKDEMADSLLMHRWDGLRMQTMDGMGWNGGRRGAWTE